MGIFSSLMHIPVGTKQPMKFNRSIVEFVIESFSIPQQDAALRFIGTKYKLKPSSEKHCVAETHPFQLGIFVYFSVSLGEYVRNHLEYDESNEEKCAFVPTCGPKETNGCGYYSKYTHTHIYIRHCCLCFSGNEFLAAMVLCCYHMQLWQLKIYTKNSETVRHTAALNTKTTSLETVWWFFVLSIVGAKTMNYYYAPIKATHTHTLTNLFVSQNAVQTVCFRLFGCIENWNVWKNCMASTEECMLRKFSFASQKFLFMLCEWECNKSNCSAGQMAEWVSDPIPVWMHSQ